MNVALYSHARMDRFVYSKDNSGSADPIVGLMKVAARVLGSVIRKAANANFQNAMRMYPARKAASVTPTAIAGQTVESRRCVPKGAHVTETPAFVSVATQAVRADSVATTTTVPRVSAVIGGPRCVSS